MKWLLRAGISGGLIGAIFWYVDDMGQLAGVIGQLSWPIVGLAILGYTAGRVLMAYKWIRLLRVQDSHLPLWRAVQIYCTSMVLGIFLPSTLGADAIRTVFTRRAGLELNQVIASIIIERGLGVVVTPLLAVIGIVAIYYAGMLGPVFVTSFWLSLGLLATALTLLWISFDERCYDFIHNRLLAGLSRFKLTRLMQKLHGVYQRYRHDKTELALFFVFTLAEQLAAIMVLWLIAWGLGIQVDLLFLCAAVSLALIVSRLPVSVGGLGVFEGVFVLLMAGAGVSAEQALTIALAGRLCQILSWLPWWVAYSLSNGGFKQVKLESEREPLA